VKGGEDAGVGGKEGFGTAVIEKVVRPEWKVAKGNGNWCRDNNSK
jgi:hypothetical protein